MPALSLRDRLWFYYVTQKVYRKTAREMKRLSSTARSPIFQRKRDHFTHSIDLHASHLADRKESPRRL